MAFVRPSIFCSFVVSLPLLDAAFPNGVEDVLQRIAQNKSSEYNCAISIAVFDGQSTVAVAAGDIDESKSRGISIEDKFAWGSGTKPLTGASILKLVDEGKFALDDPVGPLVDPLLAKMAAKDASQKFTSLVDLWGPNVTNVSVRQLAEMQSPIPDFDTANPGAGVDPLRSQLYESPQKSWSPIDLMGVPWISSLKEKWGGYSSTNFMLLGLVLAAQSGAETWLDFDQGSVLPQHLQKKIQFGTTGGPKDYSRVRGYDRTSYNMPANHTNDQDVWAVNGVFAGWTASDTVASPSAMAELYWDIYGPNPTIANNSNSTMANPAVASIQGHHHFYGFATFGLSGRTGLNETSKYGQAWGHLGATYGYQSIVLWYPALQFTMAIASNIETDNQAQPADVACFAYNAIARLMLRQESSCTFVDAGYHGGGCKCTAFAQEDDGAAPSISV